MGGPPPLSVQCPARDVSAEGDCFGLEWTLKAGERAGGAWRAFACKDPVLSQVTFLARGNVGGEVVSFAALGVRLDDQVLSQDWQRFSIDVSGLSLPPGAPVFEIDMIAGDEATTPRVFVDDIRWQPVGHCAAPLDLPATCESDTPAVATCDAIPNAAEGAAVTNQDLLLLDDFEDGDELSLPLAEGRGVWTTYNDASEASYQFPEPCPKPTTLAGPDAQSKLSLLTYGCGFNHWGAGVKLTLHDAPNACSAPLSPSGYDGIQFWAQGSMRRLILQVDTDETTPDICAAAGLPPGCRAFSKEVFLEPGWNLLQIPFSELRGPASQLYAEGTLIRSINWRFLPDAKNESYSFAIDDVALYRSNGSSSP
jgi:hypothetical protein